MHTTTFFCKRNKSNPIKLLLCSLLTLAACSITILAQSPMPDDDELQAIPDYGEQNITVSWDAVSGAEKYCIYRAPVVGDQPGQYEHIETVYHPTTTYEDTPCTEDEFFYTVTAVDDQDEESEKPDGVRQRLMTVWSVPTSLCILHS